MVFVLKKQHKKSILITLIALFGSDYSDYYETSSADTTMILAINNKNNTIKLCSLMRDIYLYLPDGDRSNLNYTILDGGIPSILRAINFNFDLRIEKFAQVDLERQRDVLNALFVKFKDSKITEFPKIINDVLPLVTTNLKMVK